jgi:hypothetical protein
MKTSAQLDNGMMDSGDTDLKYQASRKRPVSGHGQ